MKNLGDFKAGDVLYGKFTTYQPSTGAPFSLSGGSGPALKVYKNNSTTESVAGVTLTTDFDSLPGLNHFTIDTSADGTFYSEGASFDVVIASGTVDNVSVAGACVASFTLKRTALTAAQAVWDEPLAGHATAGTTGATLSGIQSDTNDIQTRIPAALVGGRMDASVGAMAADVVTASAVAASAVTEIQSGLATAAALTTVDGKVDAIKAQTDKLTFNASNAVKANITHVIDDAVQQNGSTTTNWGGTP